MRNRDKNCSQRLEHFWNVWRKDYIANLTPVVKGFKQKCNLVVGSTVLVKEDNMPRLQWPIGVIVKVYPGRDGLIRSVDVKTKKGVINRSIQRLHDLEINSYLNVDLEKNDEIVLPTQVNDNSDVNIEVDVNNVSEIDSNQNVDDSVNVVSRRGRLIKRPHKLDL